MELPGAGMSNLHSPARPAMNVDYAARPFKRAILAIIYAIARFLFAFVKRKHIDRIVGLENLPERGPFMIVANHLSYMDDFLIAYVINQYYGEKLYIPTNKKAFKGILRSWLHLAGGAVEIDPADRDQSYQVLRQLILDGKIILMFPEGTRSDGSHLLPFKFGAFNLAKDLKVTIAPVALIDTHRVLPKHGLLPVAGEKASAVFLPIIPPTVFEQQDVAQVKDACADMLAERIYGKRKWAGTYAAEMTANHLAARAESVLEALIERGPETIRGPDLKPVFDWADLARYSQVDSFAMEVQYFRAWGFRVLASPKPLAPFLLSRFRALGRGALLRDPRQPFVHYVHGQFHLRAPWIAGGRKRIALATLGRAYRWAGRYGVNRERFTISYAEALLQNGHRLRAQRLLQRDFENCKPANERERRRGERAAALMARMRNDSG
jgi:1-acyl-sn-glycerol-3-phosphate acyltransferase